MTWQEDFKKGLIPNLITFIGLVCAIVSLYYLSEKEYVKAIIWFISSWQFDFWDGFFARKLGATSQIGAFWDPLADKIITWSYLIYFWTEVNILIILFIFSLGITLTFLRVYKLNYDKQTKSGFNIMSKIAGKIKTNMERTAFGILILALTLINFNFQLPISLSTIVIISNYILGASIIFALISLINQITNFE